MHLLFLHIPKTAGSTMIDIIRNECAERSVFAFDGARASESLREFHDLPTSGLENLDVVMGHFDFGIHRALPRESRYFTILRNPVERIISHYYFVLRSPGHYLHDSVISQNLTLEQYAMSDLSFELDNGQTRMLSGMGESIALDHCGESELEAAMKNLGEYFCVVGLTERFEETLNILRNVLGWSAAPYINRNITVERPRTEEFPRDTIEAIQRRNALDLRLYEFASQIFLEQLRQYDSSKSTELCLTGLCEGPSAPAHCE